MKKSLFVLIAGSLVVAAASRAADLRIGIVGCDTSHATAFTRLINDENDPKHVAGGKVVAAFRGGSPDIEESRTRIDGYVKQLTEKYGVKMEDSIEDLCKDVDVVLLESLDGRPKLEQVRPIIKAHKPVFVDKPVAASLKDVIEIDRLARENHVPWFSSSAYRYYECMVDLKNTNVGEIRSAVSYGPCELEPHHPDLFWYGIHPTEALFTIMGPGCESVSRTATKLTDVVTGTWSDGRIGILIGQRNASTHKVIVFGSKGIAEQKGDGDYAPLVQQIMNFFQTDIAPVPNAETVEIYAFMEAADESKRKSGKPVSIKDVMRKNKGSKQIILHFH
ncbi:MAG TPA: Gfo/Idh/MocA family oxidoreductase [Verrucomicrobiae bacterium]|nr:Gfo/Idh/MocA family oxidoreductase [Verrucomicrobiae bacterium]